MGFENLKRIEQIELSEKNKGKLYVLKKLFALGPSEMTYAFKYDEMVELIESISKEVIEEEEVK